MKMNKKGMELSINYLVGLILGIILLSLGLLFTYKILAGVGQIEKVGLPDYFKIEAENCVQRGDRVCVPQIKKVTETTKPVSFGVVINNIYGSTKNFKPVVEFKRGFTEDEEEIEEEDITLSDWTFEEYDVIQLENNKYEIVEVPIRPPKTTESGTYIFNVNICFDATDNPDSKCQNTGHDSLYSPTQQITVEVI